jgi:hypothetical protein
MNGYPLVDELEVMIRVGRGVAVVVEGQSAEEDPWFYGQWFGDRARLVTFFPQDGWTRVIEAVAELRRRCPDVPVYGIIDRDFAEDEALDADFATLGILRTQSYTLENYLLDAACWAAVFRLIFRRQGGAPDGWDQTERVQAHIEAAYRSCLDLTAYNRVIKTVGERYRELAQTTAEGDREYQHHPDAFRKIGPAARLATWGQKMGCPEDLGARFHEYRSALETASVADLQKMVSGKHVLQVLQGRFPLLPRAGRFGSSHYLNLYLDRCPDPPADLIHIIDRIVADAVRPVDTEIP